MIYPAIGVGAGIAAEPWWPILQHRSIVHGTAAHPPPSPARPLQARNILGIADRSQPAPMEKLLAATIITGACTTVVRGPMDLLKSRIQIKAVRRPE